MKSSKIFQGLLLGLSLLLVASAFAANKGTLQFYNSVAVGGTQLPAGDYTVQWNGNGPNVELQILKGKKVVATTTAHAVEMSGTPNRDAVVFKVNGDGSRSLSEIRFQGKKSAFEIGGEAVGGASSGSTTVR